MRLRQSTRTLARVDDTTRNAAAPVEQFAEKVVASVREGTFVRLVVSGQRGQGPERVLGRCVELKGAPHLSLTLRYPSRDETKNLPLNRTVDWLRASLGLEFSTGLLCTTRADWQLSAAPGKRSRLIRHPASQTNAPTRAHDQARQSILDRTANDWLAALGVTDPGGRVRSGMADKHTQIHRYLELLSHLVTEAGWRGSAPGLASPERTLVDMGCGKGYLTFGLWHLCHRVWKLPVIITGIESRPDLVDETNRVARGIQADGLSFRCGDIASVPLPGLDGLIALHACDTATDEAIRRGVEHGAKLIVVAPCCHKQVRPQLRHPAPFEPVLRHGLMEERMAEWLTDGLRALFLEWAGYRTKVFEFISPEHTAKNVMIAALREREPFTDTAAQERILQLKEFWGIRNHPLDCLLRADSITR